MRNEGKFFVQNYQRHSGENSRNKPSNFVNETLDEIPFKVIQKSKTFKVIYKYSHYLVYALLVYEN